MASVRSWEELVSSLLQVPSSEPWLASMAVALSTGLYATHTLVPPTPGPIARMDAITPPFHFFGSPLVALLMGVLFTFFLPAWNQTTVNDWVGEALRTASPILLITGAGGTFGAILNLSWLKLRVFSAIP